MSGYQEVLTDPSYAGQIVTFTYPHIGNTGINAEDEESERIFAAGLVIRNLSLVASNWRSRESLESYLHRHRVVGIAEIDTRRLTRLLRERGAQNGCIVAGEGLDVEAAVTAARAWSGLEGRDLAREVSTTKVYEWTEGTIGAAPVQPRFHVVACDYGVKRNILESSPRAAADRGARPHVRRGRDRCVRSFSLQRPGRSRRGDYAIVAVRRLLETGLPIRHCLGQRSASPAARVP